MIGKNKYIWAMVVTVLFVGVFVIAQDVDEDSLLASEELSLTDSVDGDLPVADNGKDDSLSELLAGDKDSDLDTNLPDEDIPPDTSAKKGGGDDLEGLLDDVGDVDMDSAKEAPEMPAVDKVPEIDKSTNNDLGDAVGKLDTKTAQKPEGDSKDVSMDTLLGELTADESGKETNVVDKEPLDDQIAEFTAEEPAAETSKEEPVTNVEAVAEKGAIAVPEKGANAVAEKGAKAVDKTPDIDDGSETEDHVDMDALVAKLANEAEDDIGSDSLASASEKNVVKPAPVEKVKEPAPVKVVKEPAPVEKVKSAAKPNKYVDKMALDDNLFKSLADEAQGDIAAGNPAKSIDRGKTPSKPLLEPEAEIDNQIAARAKKSEAKVIPTDDLTKMEPTEVKKPVEIVEEPAKAIEKPVEIVEEPAKEIEKPVEIVEAPAKEIEKPVEIVEAPAKVIEKPAKVIEAPAKEIEKPVEIVEEPAKAIEKPAKAIEKPVEVSAEPVVVKSPEVAAFETAERLKRIAAESHAIESVSSGEQALKKKDYVKAIIHFEEALKYLPTRDDLIPMHERARKGLARASYLRALSLERMGELANAKAAALDSVKYGYKKGMETVKRIQAEIDKPPVIPPPPKKERWNQPDYIEKQKQIKMWLKRGREAYLTGEYKLAIINLESVLARDPENKEAMRLRRNASQKLYDRTTEELDGTRINMMNQVREAWSPRAKYGEYETPIQEREQTVITSDSEDKKRAALIKKMKDIRIPEIDFRQANIRDVVDFLHAQSVQFDPAKNPADRTGVNIILSLDNDEKAAAPKAAPDPWGDVGNGGGGLDNGGGSSGETLVTFSALDMTLEDALNVVVEYANLKYIIRGNIVKILPKNRAIGEIEHRMYNVLSSAIGRLDKLTQAVDTEKDRSGGGGGGGFVGMGDSGAAKLEPAGEGSDLKVLFTQLGVPWPEGSSIKYVRGLSKLVVANTLENLTIFEKVLKELNVVPYQIEIETRFVEVAQTDLDSLGLEWKLNDDYELAEKKSSAGKPLSSRERIIIDKNSDSGGFTKGNRYLTGASLDGTSIADDVLSFTSILTNPELNVVLHAIQNKGHSDLLSAPKVTTQSGQPATIKVVTEYIYPTEYTVIQGQGSGGDNAGIAPPAVEPDSFETREVGVILDVLAEVSPSGQMINLTLNPQVVTKPEWHDYGYDYYLGNMGGALASTHLRMEQPFFHTRSLSTNLLIYNGATVVMGGMITESKEDVDDKIPILGDIPIIGRLFQSRYQKSVKKNLLIFVTARLVDPSGRALGSDRFGVDGTIATKITDKGKGKK